MLECLYYAVDICVAHSHAMQHKLTTLDTEAWSARFKSKEMRVCSTFQPQLVLNNKTKENISSFCYLDSIITTDELTLEDVESQIRKATNIISFKLQTFVKCLSIFWPNTISNSELLRITREKETSREI